ncbi:MAG: enoyl-CoA hydratase/isomerase family protein [Polyangiaceae bacterium]|jgi:enoyl-CoA hydratase|nr:enoyl-CoA hydratase/isomerase family protein [Polyangiaceae bacterium]MBK8941810.1 enoyl-CoA hydratase/isomerase family protein [Polyangiaceae bacterium]
MVDVVLQGPGKNALGTPVMEQLLSDLKAAKGEPVLLTGAGDTFCAGLNLKEIGGLDAGGMESFLELFDRVVVALLSHDAPVVACVNGHAIAGGCVLMLACDLRVATASPAARLGLNEAALGLALPPRVLKLAEARLAPSHLSRVVLEAGIYAPHEALRLGLVHEVAETPEPAARALLEKLAGHPRAAYLDSKRQLNRPVVELSAEEMSAFKTRVLPQWAPAVIREAIARALAKR